MHCSFFYKGKDCSGNSVLLGPCPSFNLSEFSERSVLISTLATSLAYTAANIFSEVRKAKEINFPWIVSIKVPLNVDEGATFTGPIFFSNTPMSDVHNRKGLIFGKIVI